MTRPHFVRFRELDALHVNRDFQVHTLATDGQASIRQLIERAEQLGLGEMAFTEHVRRTSDYYPDFVREVRLERARTAVRVFVGIEAKANDDQGTLDVAPEILREAEIVLGSVHRFPGNGGSLTSAAKLPYEEAARREFDLAMGLLRHAPLTVLAHPGGMCRRAFGKFPMEYDEQLMTASLDRGIAIEINSSYHTNLDEFLDLCRRVDPLVSVGSDVHELSDLGSCRELLRARGIGCN